MSFICFGRKYILREKSESEKRLLFCSVHFQFWWKWIFRVTSRKNEQKEDRKIRWLFRSVNNEFYIFRTKKYSTWKKWIGKKATVLFSKFSVLLGPVGLVVNRDYSSSGRRGKIGIVTREHNNAPGDPVVSSYRCKFVGRHVPCIMMSYACCVVTFPDKYLIYLVRILYGRRQPRCF